MSRVVQAYRNVGIGNFREYDIETDSRYPGRKKKCASSWLDSPTALEISRTTQPSRNIPRSQSTDYSFTISLAVVFVTPYIMNYIGLTTVDLEVAVIY